MKLFQEPCLYLLLLGSIWGNTHQVTAEEEEACNSTQYMNEDLSRCCARCPPGYHMKEVCTESSDTQCQPCEDGKYASTYNHATSCRYCYPCASWLVMKEPCSATHAPVCACEDGYTCTRYNGVGTCADCEPIPNSTPAPSHSPQTSAPSGFSMDDYLLWIVIPLCIVAVVLLAVSCYYRAGIVKTIGRTFKIKRNGLSTPEAESAAFSGSADVTRAARGCPAHPLLHQDASDHAISVPMEEVGSGLPYPIQETDTTQSGECTLNSV